jgi:flagellar biosynthesis/type III secretory pathway M-ring protein FliF/YscJ
MNNLSTIIELVSVIVIAISIWGIYYFIGRIIATRGRWNDEYSEQDRKIIYEKNPEKSAPPLTKKGD